MLVAIALNIAAVLFLGWIAIWILGILGAILSRISDGNLPSSQFTPKAPLVPLEPYFPTEHEQFRDIDYRRTL